MMQKEIFFKKFLDDFMPLYFMYINPVIHKEKNQQISFSENQIKLMMIVKIVGSLTPTIIGKFLDQPKGSLTSIINSLEDIEFIVREKHPKDKRKQIIKLTQNAEDFLNTKMQKNLEKLSRIFADCPQSDFEIMLKGMELFINYLEKNGGEINV